MAVTEDFESMEIWELGYKLNPHDAIQCASIDSCLANKLTELKDALDIYYYLCYSEMHNKLPETKKKLNELFKQEELSKEEGIEWWKFRRFTEWIDNDVKSVLCKKWLNDNDAGADDIWMIETFDTASEDGIKVLDKLLSIYKKNKSRKNILLIERIFGGITAQFVDDACKIVSKATPAIRASLLTRTDISEKYTIVGLKSLAKLSKQRDVNVKIDLDMLKHLGPKGRLDAMKQLLGMFDKYYQYEKTMQQNQNQYHYSSYRYRRRPAKTYELPFSKVPNREDIQNFLFPCSMKYNEEVVSLMERYDELVKQKEVISDDKCI